MLGGKNVIGCGKVDRFTPPPLPHSTGERRHSQASLWTISLGNDWFSHDYNRGGG